MIKAAPPNVVKRLFGLKENAKRARRAQYPSLSRTA
jgi:hypothetical protein